MSAYSDLVLSDNPEVYYRCNEPSGANLQAIDASGHNRNAYYGGAGNNERATSCLVSDPDNAATGTPAATLSGDGHWASGMAAVTAEAWVRPNAGGHTAGLLTHSYAGTFGTPDAGTWALFLNAGKPFWRVYNASFNPLFSLEAPAPLTPSVDSHVVGTWDGTTARLYVNGAEVASVAAAGTMATTARAIGLGCFAVYSRLGITGAVVIDEVAGYSTALSAAKVLAHWETGHNPTPTGPGHTFYLGNTRVDKLYLGNTQIDKVYLGNTQIT